MLLKLDNDKYTYIGFPTRIVYLHYISCLRFTILVGTLYI